jgi:hypothetical protein
MVQLAVFLTLISTAWARPDFIEAQMTIDQGHEPACTWNSQEDLFTVEMGLNWLNFDPDLHSGGFNFNDTLSSYIIFPDVVEGCKYVGDSGFLSEPAAAEKSHLTLKFFGKTCQEMRERLSVGSLAISHYEVPAYSSERERVPVLRLQIWDARISEPCTK